VLTVDDSRQFEPFEMAFHAPKDDDGTDAADRGTVTTDELCDIVWSLINGQTDRAVDSRRRLLAIMRDAGQSFQDGALRLALDLLAWMHRCGMGLGWVVAAKCPVVVEE